MKLVVTFTAGDGCTYSCEVDCPVEYESEEALAVHLEEHCKAWAAKYLMGAPEGVNLGDWWIEREKADRFPGTNLFASELLFDKEYVAPEIRTLEAWFEAQSKPSGY